MKIERVMICGLGALGLTYANKLKDICDLKILANNERVIKYKTQVPTLNDEKIELDYITPDKNWTPDLIIISTKSTGLSSAIEYLKNFVSENTIIISLINGISSEETISKAYPQAKVLRSYFIGHSAVRDGFKTTQDGIGKIVFEQNEKLEAFFKVNRIDYEVSNEIVYAQWVKLGVNIILNEPSAIYKCTVGELKKRDDYVFLAQNLLKEVKEVAQACGVKCSENYETEVFNSINLIADDGKTSMYQDIVANRETEVEIFSGEIIKLGKQYKISTPVNQKIYNQLKFL